MYSAQVDGTLQLREDMNDLQATTRLDLGLLLEAYC